MESPTLGPSERRVLTWRNQPPSKRVQPLHDPPPRDGRRRTRRARGGRTSTRGRPASPRAPSSCCRDPCSWAAAGGRGAVGARAATPGGGWRGGVAPGHPLPPEAPSITWHAAGPFAGPLTVPGCCAVMFVQPSIASTATVVKANLILSISSLRHLFVLSPGTTISNQMVSSTGRCNCSGCAPYHLSRLSSTPLNVCPVIPLAARGARLRPSGVGLSAWYATSS